MLFFPALRTALKGEMLNGLVMDNENTPKGPSLFLVQRLSLFNKTNVTQARRCLRARYTATQRDPRFRSVLALLEERGWNVTERSGLEWLADAMVPLSEPGTYKIQGGSRDMNRKVWDAVGLERVSQYWSTAIGSVARAVFPGLVHTNFGRFVWSADHCTPDSRGWAKCQAGVGSSGYDVSAPSVCEFQHQQHSCALTPSILR